MVLGIGTSRGDVSLLSSLQRANQQLTAVGGRLATMQRIRRASDDPAGLIAAELLARDLESLRAATDSAVWSHSLIASADSTLSSAGDLLADVRAAMVAGANGVTSPEQREALQQQVDASLDALGRLGNSTFAGRAVFGDSHELLVGSSPDETVSLDMPALNESLGGAAGNLADLRSGGAASLTDGDPSLAVQIIDQAQAEILSARATAGSVESTIVDSWERAAAENEEQLLSAWSAIRDADVALESSNWVRGRVQSQASFAVASLAQQARWQTLQGLNDLLRPRGIA